MKRILIFSLAYYPRFVGGAEVAIKEITDRISPEEIEFHMVTLRFDSSLPRHSKEGNVFVHRVGFGRRNASVASTHHPLVYIDKVLFVPLAALAALRLHNAQHFDAWWAMMSYMVFPIVLLRIIGVRPPYVLTLEEGDPFEHVYGRAHIRFFEPLLRWGFRHASAVHAESTFLGTWARQWGFQGPLEVIPNGMDAERFKQMPPSELLEIIRTKIGKRGGETWLIHTGRLVHKNALDVCIRALPLLPEQVHLFMLGDGPDKEMLAELADELGVSARVHFHPYVSIEEVPNYLKSCDIFIRPSRSEGMGNSFIEAMAAGLPVIATQEGGIADFLFDAKRNPDKETTGWAVDMDSPEQIATVVKEILSDTAQTARVTATAKQLVFKDYDWDLIARKMRMLFDRLFETK